MNSLRYDWGHSVITHVMDGQVLFHKYTDIMGHGVQTSFHFGGVSKVCKQLKGGEAGKRGKEVKITWCFFCFWDRQFLSLGRN